MKSRDGQENKPKGKSLVIALVLLILAIIILVISIVVTAVNNNSQSGNAEEEYTLPEELQGDDLSPVNQVIKDTSLMLNDPSVSTEEIESYYDEAIIDALNSDENDYAIEIIIQKMNYLAVIKNDCPAASDYINSVNLFPYADNLKHYLSSYVISMAMECNNQELMDEWNGKF